MDMVDFEKLAQEIVGEGEIDFMCPSLKYRIADFGRKMYTQGQSDALERAAKVADNCRHHRDCCHDGCCGQAYIANAIRQLKEDLK